MSEVKMVIFDGLWRNNPALVQLLGLCPLIAITSTFTNGLALGLATTTVIVITNVTVSLIRRTLIPATRIIVFVMIIASLVTIALHQTLGLFIPLIVTNCAILAQAEVVASRHSAGVAAISGLSTGIGFTFALVALGTFREAVGQGTLFAGIDQLVGQTATDIYLNLPFDGLLAVALPPGAFFGLALLIALRNYLSDECIDTED